MVSAAAVVSAPQLVKPDRAWAGGGDRVMPLCRQGGPASSLCVYHWHEVGCKKKGACIYGGHMTKVEYEGDPSKYKNADFSKDSKKAPKEQAAAAAPTQSTASLETKFGSTIEIVRGISAAQQEPLAAVMEFKKKQVQADLETQKESARRKARFEARQAAQSNASMNGGSIGNRNGGEQLRFMAQQDGSDGES